MSLVQEENTQSGQEQRRRRYQIKFDVTGEEYRELQAMADYLYKERALESPRVSAAAKAAMFKFYNELNSVLLGGRKPNLGEQDRSSTY